MAVYVILPESMLTTKVQDTNLILDDDELSLELHENPSPTMFAPDTVSVTDSVDLLMERCPLLIRSSDEELDEDDSETDDLEGDYLSVTEFHVPLNDISKETRRTDTSKTSVPRRKRRLTPSSFHDSFGPLDVEYDLQDELDDFDDDDDDVDSIDFPNFHFSESQPLTVSVIPSTTGTSLCN